MDTESDDCVRILQSVFADKDSGIKLLHVNCAFFYGPMRRDVYIQLPCQDPRHSLGAAEPKMGVQEAN